LVLATQPVSIPCDACGNTRQPSLEEFASGPALATRYQALTGKPTARAEEVMEAANMGNAEARTVVESAGQALGVSLGWLVNVLDPEAIVAGGGLGSAGGLYWESLVASTRKHVWAEASRSLPIITAQLGAEAGLIGAALAGAISAKEIRFAGTP
jgi:glucokinase